MLLKLGRHLPRRVLRRLPARIAVPVLSSMGWPRLDTCDLRSIPVPEPFRLDAYWVRVSGQEGPAASLFFEQDEILRVDCLPEDPHLHYGLAGSRRRQPLEPRVYLAEDDVDAQIERARFEVARNVAYCTGLDRRQSVRRAPVDEAAFSAAADQMASYLRELVAQHGA